MHRSLNPAVFSPSIPGYSKFLYFSISFTDNLYMTDLIPVIKAVLMNKKVIFSAIACFLLMDFASYICRYRKKPVQKRVKKAAAAPAPAAQESAGTEGEEDAGDE